MVRRIWGNINFLLVEMCSTLTYVLGLACPAVKLVSTTGVVLGHKYSVILAIITAF